MKSSRYSSSSQRRVSLLFYMSDHSGCFLPYSSRGLSYDGPFAFYGVVPVAPG